jgi:VWFA-related protein
MIRATLAALLLATSALAQQFEEQVSVSYVMIPFTALSSNGAPVTTLKAKDVSLLVDGQPVATDMFEMSFNTPVSWTILLDGSGSMGLAGKIDAAKAAINALTARRRPGDDFALYVFDSGGHANALVPFTENPSAITRALDVVTPWGKTAFFDALAEMPARTELGRNPSRAIILLSDGIDNNSKLTREQIQKRLEAVAIPIYAFGLREPAEQKLIPALTEEMANIDLLEELASATGGKLFVGNQPEQIAQAMDGIERASRAQYLIGFSPTGKGTVKYRRISLKLAGRVRSVRVRAGYRGTEPPVMSASRGNKRNERKKG